MPYLIVDNAALFDQFMKNVFEAKELRKVIRDDAPGIMHAEVQIGDSTIMFGDSTPQWPVVTAGLYINVADADATYQKPCRKALPPLWPRLTSPMAEPVG